MSITKSDVILAGNPYFITYTGTYNLYDYITVDLYMWEGAFSATPSTPNHSFTVYKRKTTDSTTFVDISQYLKDNIEPTISSVWIDDEIYDANFKEFINVGWKIRSYKITGGAGVQYQVVNSPHKVACLGKTTHRQGANPTYTGINDFSVNTAEKYYTSSSPVYSATFNASASNTNDIIYRESTENYKVVCSGKYTPYEIIFLNRYGIWDSFIFPKSSKRSVKFKSDTYTRMISNPYSYDSTISPEVVYNKNGSVEWELNTDLLDDANLKYIEDIHSTNRWYMVQNGYIVPVILIDTDFGEKRSVNEKAKSNYTLKFKEAADYIQNIR